MSKWTPGPWKANYQTGQSGPIKGKRVVANIGNKELRKNVVFPNWTLSRDGDVYEAWLSVSEADAALISAAPDLAEALENLVNEIVEYNPTNINITAARAALDKAKGER